MSFILEEFNKKDYIKELKNFYIFSTHLLVIDTDFKIKSEYYKKDAPNLIIISPKIFFEKTTTIDLSCDRIPDYPNGQKYAKNGAYPSGNGEDGLPGDPGYNGGNLLIASTVIDYMNINFISNGGIGGPGQNGNLSNKILKLTNLVIRNLKCFFLVFTSFYLNSFNCVLFML